MAKKKRSAKKKVRRNIKSKKKARTIRRVARAPSRPSRASKVVRSTKRKINLVFKNFIIFAILSLISYWVFRASTDVSIQNIFTLLSFITGSISVLFLIAWLILLLLRVMKR